MAVVYLVAMLIAIVVVGLSIYAGKSRTSYDSFYYYAASDGHRTPKPYCFRVLLPLVCGRRVWAWRTVAIISTILIGPMLVRYLHVLGYGRWWCVMGVVLWAGLYGVAGEHVTHHIIPDPLAQFLSLMAATLYLSNHLLPATIIALLAMLTKEISPLFIALFAWTPLPLIVYPLLWMVWKWRGKSSTNNPHLHSPLVTVWQRRHSREELTWQYLVSPWGVVLPLALSCPNVQLLATLTASYGQLLLATDGSRLYMWAFPVVISFTLSTLQHVPVWLIGPMVLLHLSHPYRGSDV